jgi:hypothetical protein
LANKKNIFSSGKSLPSPGIPDAIRKLEKYKELFVLVEPDIPLFGKVSFVAAHTCGR